MLITWKGIFPYDKRWNHAIAGYEVLESGRTLIKFYLCLEDVNSHVDQDQNNSHDGEFSSRLWLFGSDRDEHKLE